MRKIRFLILTVIFLNTGTEGILVPYPLINGSNRLTGEYTKENWGTWIFTRCEDLDMSLIRKTPKEYLSVHADMNRIFYLLWEENSGMRKFKWRKIFGKKGRKDGEFRGCKGVCIDTTPRQNNPGDYFIYVADSRNDRIVCLRYHKKDEKMHFVCNINQTPRGKFKNPVDVSTLTLGEDNFFLLITDKGNHRIVLCHYVPGSGNTYISYGSEGEEEGKFYYPTSAVIVPADEGYRIYVADAGNSRVVLLNMDENYQISWVRTVKIGNVYLGDCSVEVSVYDKAVYLISEKKCRIYMTGI